MAWSAKRLGEKIGLTSHEMNFLLKEEGYQNGEPGDYSTTDKGKEYVSEKGWDNGYGGYAFRGYNYNEWDESILNNIDTSPERLSQIRTKTANERMLFPFRGILISPFIYAYFLRVLDI